VKIHNVHERVLNASPDDVGALLDEVDRLWPTQPQRERDRLRLDPIAFEVLEHRPKERITFRIVHPEGFDADHWLEVEPTADGRAVLRHVLDGDVTGSAEALWRGGLERGHNWYSEALLDRAEEALR
jgi:hypothetical protein